MNPININALTKWASDFQTLSRDFIMNAHKKSSMLGILRYDTDHIPPYYGKADPVVIENSKLLSQRRK